MAPSPLPPWTEEPIKKEHRRGEFDCGEPALNEYLVKFARQNHESGAAKTFVAAPVDDPLRVWGYYTVSPAALAFDLPTTITRGLGRYDVAAFRLARIATDRSLHGRGLGGQLLLTAGSRVLRVAALVGGVALVIDAKNERAAEWYAEHGAVPLLDNPLTLVLPLATLQSALRG